MGRAAEGMKEKIYGKERGQWKNIVTGRKNAEGSTEGRILRKEAFMTGQYELLFYAGDYLHKFGPPADGLRFLDQIPIRFGINDRNQHYHVPLLLTPFSYSTYRGS